MLTNSPESLDYFKLTRESSHLDFSMCTKTVKLAILADFASQQLVPLLSTLFCKQKIRAEVYAAEFNAIETEVFDVRSRLYAFKPHIVLIMNSTQALSLNYYYRAGTGEVFLEETVARMVQVWDCLKDQMSAVIIQSNYVLPYERIFGNYDHKIAGSLYAVAIELNARLSEASRSRDYVLINDLDAMAAYMGRKHWFDEKLWILGKSLCSLQCLPLVAQNVVSMVMATRGGGVKCIILDLDNTLWGGVIGDDGMEGIQLGHYGEGEAYRRFQYYLLELKKRGIILAVCSKNEAETAVLPFRKHPDMVLKEDDISVFVANWENKVHNIKRIRDALDIGFDSMVLLDDNPYERNLVRTMLPEVIVPELPDDPAQYVRCLSELNLFETCSFSVEDTQRTKLYRDEAKRRDLAGSFVDINDYLKSLQMKIKVCRFDSFHLPRIAQLMQRSNQFNLTTRRYNVAECEQLMNDRSVYPFYVTLTDKFGDYGLISVVVLRRDGVEMDVDTWLMSCRVLARGVEQYVMGFVVELALHLGVTSVVGKYIPTTKNGMVKDFFKSFGFTLDAQVADGGGQWRLDVTSYRPQQAFMGEAI